MKTIEVPFKKEVEKFLQSLPQTDLKEIAYANIDPDSDLADEEMVEGKNDSTLISELTEIICNQSWGGTLEEDIEDKREWMKDYLR